MSCIRRCCMERLKETPLTYESTTTPINPSHPHSTKRIKYQPSLSLSTFISGNSYSPSAALYFALRRGRVFAPNKFLSTVTSPIVGFSPWYEFARSRAQCLTLSVQSRYLVSFSLFTTERDLGTPSTVSTESLESLESACSCCHLDSNAKMRWCLTQALRRSFPGMFLF
jgi:hypothetical protein